MINIIIGLVGLWIVAKLYRSMATIFPLCSPSIGQAWQKVLEWQRMGKG